MFLRAILIGLTVLLFAGVGGFAVYDTLKTDGGDGGASETSDSPPTCEIFRERAGRTVLPVGATVPTFNRKTFDGQNVNLNRLLDEKPFTLVEIFASWCPHCQESIPGLKLIQSEFGSKVSLVAFNAGDRPDEPSTSQAFKDQYYINYPIIDGMSKAAMERHCLAGFPTMYLVDRNRKILWHLVGTLEGEDLAALKETLAQTK